MVFAARRCFGLSLLIVVSGCVAPPKTPLLSNVAVKRTVPSHWYDPTHRDYYDVYGPVKKLVLLPVDADTVKTGRWELYFNHQGRLARQVTTRQGRGFEINYRYNNDGKLSRIDSFADGEAFRSTLFEYGARGVLQNKRFVDHRSQSQFNVKQKRQAVAGGWFQIAKPVEKIAMIDYRRFDIDKGLVWSSKGSLNNGAGHAYYIQTADKINAADVRNGNTPQMQGAGGYGYEYDGRGRLKKVSSFNANGGSLYHYTRYLYNAHGLLRQEIKSVVGESLFNVARSQQVRYKYQVTDMHGNWTHRIVTVTNGDDSFEYEQQRAIDYYVNRDS
jgi:hypothetical protein